MSWEASLYRTTWPVYHLTSLFPPFCFYETAPFYFETNWLFVLFKRTVITSDARTEARLRENVAIIGQIWIITCFQHFSHCTNCHHGPRFWNNPHLLNKHGYFAANRKHLFWKTFRSFLARRSLHTQRSVKHAPPQFAGNSSTISNERSNVSSTYVPLELWTVFFKGPLNG